MGKSMLEMSLMDADNIEKYLKEVFPGKKLAKSALRIKFGLPYTRSAQVWAILESRGFINDHYTLLIPKLEPV